MPASVDSSIILRLNPWITGSWSKKMIDRQAIPRAWWCTARSRDKTMKGTSGQPSGGSDWWWTCLCFLHLSIGSPSRTGMWKRSRLTVECWTVDLFLFVPKVWLSPNVDRILRLWQSHGCWIKMCVEDLIQRPSGTCLLIDLKIDLGSFFSFSF